MAHTLAIIVAEKKPVRCHLGFHKWFLADLCFKQMKKSPLTTFYGFVIRCIHCGKLRDESGQDPEHPNCCVGIPRIGLHQMNKMILSTWERW